MLKNDTFFNHKLKWQKVQSKLSKIHDHLNRVLIVGGPEPGNECLTKYDQLPTKYWYHFIPERFMSTKASVTN